MRGCLTVCTINTISSTSDCFLQQFHAYINSSDFFLRWTFTPNALHQKVWEEHTALFLWTLGALTSTHLDQSSHRLPDLYLIYASDSRVKYELHSLYYTSMVISSIKHLHMSIARIVLCSTSSLQLSATIPGGKLMFQAPDVNNRAQASHRGGGGKSHARLETKTIFLQTPFINKTKHHLYKGKSQ